MSQSEKKAERRLSLSDSDIRTEVTRSNSKRSPVRGISTVILALGLTSVVTTGCTDDKEACDYDSTRYADPGVWVGNVYYYDSDYTRYADAKLCDSD